MFKTLANAMKVKEIRMRLLFTFLMLLVVRFGSLLPIPGVDTSYFNTLMSGDGFDFFNAVTGGSFLTMSVFALSITPYITSSIIMQLLTIAIPKLEEMQEDCRVYTLCDGCSCFNRKYCDGSRIWRSWSF